MHTPSMNSREGAALHQGSDKGVSSGKATTPALEPAEQEKGTGTVFRDPQGRRGGAVDCDRRKGVVCLPGCAWELGREDGVTDTSRVGSKGC